MTEMCCRGSKWRHLVLQLWPPRHVACVYVPLQFESTIAYYTAHIFTMHEVCILFVNATLEGAAFTSQIQISQMHYNCFVYIVHEWIKGAFSVCRPCTKEKDFMLMALPCVVGMLPASIEWCSLWKVLVSVPLSLNRFTMLTCITFLAFGLFIIYL